MTIKEHLDLLFRTELVLNGVLRNGIDKESIEHLINFEQTLDDVEVSSLFDHSLNLDHGELLVNYRKKLNNVKLLMVNCESVCAYENIYYLIKRIASPNSLEVEMCEKDDQERWNTFVQLNNQLESMSQHYSSDSPIFLAKIEEVINAKSDFKRGKVITEEARARRNTKIKALEYLQDVNILKGIQKVEFIAESLDKLIISNKNLQKLLVKDTTIFHIHSIFVDLDLIKEVPFQDFQKQIENNPFSFQKNSGKDKYISYAIEKIAATLVIPEAAESWKNLMINYFELKDHEKKINPNAENRNEKHSAIDKILTDANECIIRSNKKKLEFKKSKNRP